MGTVVIAGGRRDRRLQCVEALRSISMTMREPQSVPIWVLSLLIGLASVGLTLTFDRATIAGNLATLAARVEGLEKQAETTTQMHGAIMIQLDDLKNTDEKAAILLQQLADRQDEIRRKLGIQR